jgi:alanine racemase
VLVRGRRARIVGRVSMDQIVVDVTDIADVQHDDEVVILGQQGEGQITAEEIAAWSGTINYDVVTGITPRVPRVYKRGDEVVASESLVDDWEGVFDI